MIRAALFVLGLLFGLLPQAAHAQDFGNCTDRGYLYHFDPRLDARECHEITTVTIRGRGGSALLRAIRPVEMPMGDEAQITRRVEEAAARIGAAMDEMGPGLHLDNITLLFTNYVSPRATMRDEGFDKGAYIGAAHDIFADECPVSYYKGSHATMDANDFVFTLAHEVFHCIEFRTWPSMPDEGWLIEAGAEYFAYLAKPDYGAGFIPSFDEQIQTVPLDNLEYPAVVFYLWMGDAYGPSRVREFLGSARSLDSAVNSDMWITFAQRYYDQAVRLPGGVGSIPSSPRIGPTRAILGDDHLETPAMIPYTLHNAIFVFDRDRAYTLTHTPNPPDVRVLWKRSDNWIEPPTSVTTCDGEERFRAIWASTHSTEGGSTDIRAAPTSAGVCTCPVGVWRETSDSLHHYFEQSATGGPGAVEFVGGGRVLTLNPDGTGSFIYEGVITETHNNPSFWLRQTKTGGTHFTWHAREGRLLTTLIPGDNLLNLYNEMHTAGVGTRVENRRAGAQSIGHNFSCDGSGLHLRQIARASTAPGFPGISVDMDFARAGDSGR